MSQTNMLTVFCYDISNDKKRRRVATIMEDYAVRVQMSVFEAILDETSVRNIASEVGAELDPGDSFRIYCISDIGRRRSFTVGSGAGILEEDEFIIL